MIFLADVSRFLITSVNLLLCLFVLTVSFFFFVEMESSKQRVRATAAHQKEKKRAKEAGGETSSTPKAVTKLSKRKFKGSDGCLS